MYSAAEVTLLTVVPRKPRKRGSGLGEIRTNGHTRRKFREMWNNGTYIKTMCLHFSVSLSVIHKWRVQMGLPPRYRKYVVHELFRDGEGI